MISYLQILIFAKHFSCSSFQYIAEVKMDIILIPIITAIKHTFCTTLKPQNMDAAVLCKTWCHRIPKYIKGAKWLLIALDVRNIWLQVLHEMSFCTSWFPKRWNQNFSFPIWICGCGNGFGRVCVPVAGTEEKREPAICYVCLCQSVWPCHHRAKTFHNLIWGQSALFREKGRNTKEYLLLCAETVLAKQKVAAIPSADRINSIYSEAH